MLYKLDQISYPTNVLLTRVETDHMHSLYPTKLSEHTFIYSELTVVSL